MMIVNLQTKQWLSLMVGGVVLDAKFVEASGETARISIGDKEFEVKTGAGSLGKNAREPLEPVDCPYAKGETLPRGGVCEA